MIETPSDNGQKLRWMCRRGMLELDIWLMKYLEEAYPKASVLDQQNFSALLSEEDSDIYAWLMYHQPVKSELAEIVKKVQAVNHIKDVT